VYNIITMARYSNTNILICIKYKYNITNKKSFRFGAEHWMYWFYNYVFFIFFFWLSSPFVSVKLLRFLLTVCILFDWKVNLVGIFGKSKFKIPNSFQKCREKQHKILKKKPVIFTKNQFLTKLILVFVVTLKQMTI